MIKLIVRPARRVTISAQLSLVDPVTSCKLLQLLCVLSLTNKMMMMMMTMMNWCRICWWQLPSANAEASLRSPVWGHTSSSII